jgi:hypothetical protein
MPETTIEKENKRRITAINIVITVCDIEEGAPSRSYVTQKRSANTIDILPAAPPSKRQNLTPLDKTDDTFSKAIASVYVKSPNKRPTIYFICLSTPRLL